MVNVLMKSDVVYNHWDNMVYVKTNGDEIHVICDKESQMDQVVERMTTDTCILSGYEEWDEDDDKKWIANLRGLNNMDFFKKHLDKIWGIGIGFVVGFLVAGWASSAGILTGF